MKLKSYLFIKKLPILANIGAFSYEFNVKQAILLDIKIVFSTLPVGCMSDQLSDVYCYQTLIEEIVAFVDTKHFNLIEHLAHEILALLKNKFPQDAIIVKVTKLPIINSHKQIISFIVESC